MSLLWLNSALPPQIMINLLVPSGTVVFTQAAELAQSGQHSKTWQSPRASPFTTEGLQQFADEGPPQDASFYKTDGIRVL